jgi:hypothetical protein
VACGICRSYRCQELRFSCQGPAPFQVRFTCGRRSLHCGNFCLARSAVSVGQESLLCLTQHESILGTEGNGALRLSSHINAQTLLFYALLSRGHHFSRPEYTQIAPKSERNLTPSLDICPSTTGWSSSPLGPPTGLHRSRLLALIPTPIHEACPFRMPITECSR